MLTKFINGGSEYCIMCLDYKEIYIFDSYGALKSKSGTISSTRGIIQDVDILSMVDTGIGTTEIFFNGTKVIFNKKMLQVLSDIKKFGNYMGTTFYINHKDSKSSFTQVLLVYQRGIINLNKLSELVQ